ncbi:hypothetical protein [Streptomyces sp. NRRL WC-3618]|uniref:hypothetical protein n=1 Tax=Streptomyces sp. NRRL WC-3618 TaxID=1519490 RepID=UPI000ADA6A19|nr:hypothetical protein [Streptomyces sp. NRRL WC-3618]
MTTSTPPLRSRPAPSAGRQETASCFSATTRTAAHLVGGREVRQGESYFLTRLSAADINPAAATQPGTIREYRWWTLAELHTAQETVYPAGLADMVAAVATGRTPRQPVVLAD